MFINFFTNVSGCFSVHEMAHMLKMEVKVIDRKVSRTLFVIKAQRAANTSHPSKNMIFHKTWWLLVSDIFFFILHHSLS